MSTNLPRVFVLGASLTIQFGPYLEKELAGHFQYDRKRALDGKKAEDDLDFPQGENGGDSAMCLSYLRHRRESDPIKADILVLSCGLHDMKTDPKTGARQVPPEQFQKNLREIVKEVAAIGAKLVWLRITPVVDEIHNARSKSFHRFAADVDRYNALADEVMRDAAHVIDFYAFCAALVPEAFVDHVHYSEPARMKQAKFIADDLKRWWRPR
jgi:lysophospholipase L1-like esterase